MGYAGVPMRLYKTAPNGPYQEKHWLRGLHGFECGSTKSRMARRSSSNWNGLDSTASARSLSAARDTVPTWRSVAEKGDMC